MSGRKTQISPNEVLRGRLGTLKELPDTRTCEPSIYRVPPLSSASTAKQQHEDTTLAHVSLGKKCHYGWSMTKSISSVKEKLFWLLPSLNAASSSGACSLESNRTLEVASKGSSFVGTAEEG